MTPTPPISTDLGDIDNLVEPEGIDPSTDNRVLPDFIVPGRLLEEVFSVLGELPTRVSGRLFGELVGSIRPVDQNPTEDPVSS